MQDYYSSLKIFHHKDRLDALKADKPTIPIHVHLIPTNRCNQNCNFCAYRKEGYSSKSTFDAREQIPTKKLLSLVDDFAEIGVKAVELTGGGEPTVHPGFVDLCNALKANSIDYGVVTNGINQSPSITDALAKASWVRFSRDSATPETYSRIRCVPKHQYYASRRHTKTVLKVCGPNTIVGVGFVVTKHNWIETALAIAQAKEDGADNIRISAVFQSEGVSYFDDFASKVISQLNYAKRKYEDEKFRIFDLFSDRLQDLEQQSPDYDTCHIQKLMTYIGADQNVYRCCVTAYNSLGLLGSIKGQSFKRFWQDPTTVEKLRSFNAKQCPLCMFNGKNATIDYALADDPGHVNFL